jgi:hypothetical protein
VTELGAIRDTYLTLVDCHTVTAELLRKSSKGSTFHGTVFLNQPLDETKRLLAQAKAELDDWAIVSMVSIFERILFKHDQSPLRSKTLREGADGLHNAIKQFKKHVSPRTYEDVERLCHYRDWVAHGKRWEKPAHADPVSAYQRLADFLAQAGLETKAHD